MKSRKTIGTTLLGATLLASATFAINEIDFTQQLLDASPTELVSKSKVKELSNDFSEYSSLDWAKLKVLKSMVVYLEKKNNIEPYAYYGYLISDNDTYETPRLEGYTPSVAGQVANNEKMIAGMYNALGSTFKKEISSLSPERMHEVKRAITIAETLLNEVSAKSLSDAMKISKNLAAKYLSYYKGESSEYPSEMNNINHQDELVMKFILRRKLNENNSPELIETYKRIVADLKGALKTPKALSERILKDNPKNIFNLTEMVESLTKYNNGEGISSYAYFSVKHRSLYNIIDAYKLRSPDFSYVLSTAEDKNSMAYTVSPAGELANNVQVIKHISNGLADDLGAALELLPAGAKKEINGKINLALATLDIENGSDLARSFNINVGDAQRLLDLYTSKNHLSSAESSEVRNLIHTLSDNDNNTEYVFQFMMRRLHTSDAASKEELVQAYKDSLTKVQLIMNGKLEPAKSLTDRALDYMNGVRNSVMSLFE